MKNRKQGLWLISLFICLTLCLDILTFMTPAKDFSETENRTLAKSPEISFDALSNGSFADGAEDYFSDHFAYRDRWSAITFYVRSLLGQREMNGVYIGEDNYLFLIPSEPNSAALQKNIDAINDFAAYRDDINQCMAIIPNSAFIMKHKLPKHAPVPDQSEQLGTIKGKLKNITFTDVTDTLLSHNSEDLYYHTDHHWTSLGAYHAFIKIADDLQIDASACRYDIHTVTDTFEGTLSSKSGSHIYKDTIEIYVPKTDIDYNITYSDGSGAKGSMYERECLETKDKYAVFLGGNHPVVQIKTTADTQRHLLIIKDSYANSFVQFLTPYFDEIVLADPRYCYDSIETFVNHQGITDILYLYNLDTFQTDTSIADFLCITPNTD